MPEEAIETCIGSISKRTLSQYNTAYKEWWLFCHELKINIYTASVNEVLKFLQSMVSKKNWKYGTFNSCRSALSLILQFDVGKDLNIRRFLRGVARARPSRPKYASIWDPKMVLNYLEKKYPNEDLSIKDLGMKLIALLALITGQRIQTLSKIRVDQIIVTTDGIQIAIPDRVKTSGIGTYQPCLNIPFFTLKPKLCAASTILTYLEKTSGQRNETSQYLFISDRKPYKNLSKDTLARWVKIVLKNAGVNTDIFTSHSTRHASTSKAWRMGVSVDTIRKTAGWSESSSVFAQFYNRPLQDKYSFARAVMAVSS